MPNPYGIEQVDVPGILGVYQGAQDRRVNQMLMQRKIAAEDRAVEQQHTISSIWKNYADPTKGGDPSSSAGAASPLAAPYAGSAAAPAAPSPALTTAVPPSPISSAYAVSAPVAPEPDNPDPPGATAAPAAAAAGIPNLPPPNPASITPADKSFVEANDAGIRQLLGLNPEQGMAMLKFAQGLDSDRRAKIVDAQDAIHTAAVGLMDIPYAQRKAALLAQGPELLAAHPGLTPQLIQNFDPTDQNIHSAIGQSVGIKGMMDYAEKTATQAETHRHNVADETNSANNGYLSAGYLPPGSPPVASGDGTTPAIGSGTTQRYAGGWTPRTRNGGDNSDAAVNSKIAGAAQYLGVAPGADISQLPPLKIAQAMTLSEGGAGSLADRNNNPANIRNSDGTFKKFPTKEAGLQAAAQLVQRKLANGQTSVQSIIEGLPKGGASSAPANGLRVIPGGKLDQSGEVQLDEAGMNLAAEQYRTFGTLPAIGMGKAAATLRSQIISRAARINTDNGISAADAMGNRADFHANQAALTTLSRTASQVLAFEDTAKRNGILALQKAAKAGNGNVPIFNSWVNAGRKATGDPDVAAMNAAVETFANEYAKVVSGATGGAVTSDTARAHANSLINSAMSPTQLKSVMSTLFSDMENRKAGLEGQQNALRQQLRGGHSSSATPSSGWGKATVVQ